VFGFLRSSVQKSHRFVHTLSGNHHAAPAALLLIKVITITHVIHITISNSFPQTDNVFTLSLPTVFLTACVYTYLFICSLFYDALSVTKTMQHRMKG
jgi:hypothetical protein